MKRILVPLFLSLSATLSFGEVPGNPYTRTLFSDDFSGSEFGKAWGHYKSGSIVKDGMLIGITPENSDHSAVDHVRIEPERDLEVSVKFRFVSEKAKSFNVWFDDKNFKGSHAGHICSVTVYPTSVVIADAKTGGFRNDIYAKKKSPEGLSAEDKAFLQTKTKRVPASLTREEWHTLTIRTKADQVEVSLDGKKVGDFQSEGIAHDSKTLVSLTTNPVDVHYDDFSIKATGTPAAK